MALLARLRGLPSGVGLLLAVLLVVWGVLAGYLTRQARQGEADAYQTAGDLARGFGESVARTLEAMDQVFAMLRAFHRADPARFDLESLAPRDQVLNDLTLQIAMTNARGMMTASNLGGPPVDLSDREHIRVHLERPGDFLFVSRPVLGRVSKRWSIQLTRKLFAADGSLAGVMVISLDPAYFARFYQSFNAPGGAIALFGLDGVYRARAPAVEGALGAPVGALTLAQVRGGRDSGTWRGTSEIDGVERLYAFRRLDRYGLAVSVGLSAEVVGEAFRAEAVWFVVAGVAATLVVGVVGQMLIRSRRRLEESERALSATLENMNQGILMVDAAGRVPVINGRAAELLDLPAAVARPGTSFRAILEWQIRQGEFVPEGSGIDVDALARAGGLGPEVYERARPNGRVLEVLTRNLAGGGAVRTFTDITERKRNETALAMARDAAEAASEARASFMATMSHELRTPLNAVIGMAGLLIDGELPPHLRRYAATLRDAAGTLLQVIDDILDFSRLDAERMELEEIPFELAPLVASVVGLMEVRAAEKGLRLEMAVPGDVPVLLGDPGRLRQVLLNLVSNGVKFTEVGGVAVRATVAPLDAGRVRLGIAVRDSGVGIAPEAQARLFEPFTQLDGSISRRYGGSGLGLAICRRLLERMGGTISVASRAGEGAVFSVDLPMRLAGAAARDVGEVPRAVGHVARRLRILLAEDNATNRMVAVTRLEAMGHRVDAVADGAEAVRSVQAAPYDLVLMDVMMPGVDGLAATRAIRGLGGAVSEIPVVAVTANVFRSHQEACLAAGMDDFVSKPVTEAALERVLARAMAGGLRGGGRLAEDVGAVLERLGRSFGEDGRAVLAAFVAEAGVQVAAMRAALAAGDGAAAEAAALVVRDAAQTLGLAGRLGAGAGDPGALEAAVRGLAAALAADDAQVARDQASRLR